MRKSHKVLSVAISACLSVGMCVSAYAAQDSMENFQKSETYTGQFADVSNTHWAASSIKLCYEYGLMNGSDKGFLPSNNLTVAEALVMADRVHQIYTDGESTLKNGTPWYQTYVTYAIENGIINAGDFSNYTTKATRGEMAYIFAHALPDSELSAVNAVTALPDVNVSTAYSKEIFTLYNAGVLTGSDEFGTYKPTSTITRAEAAAIISRVAVPAQRKTVSLKEYASIKQGLYTIPGTERMLYVAQDGSNIEFYLWWFHDYCRTGTAVLKGNEATLPSMMLQSGDYISGTLRFNGSSVALTFDRNPVYFDQNWNFTWCRESFRLSNAQLRDIARSLGVPDSLDVEYEQGEAAYWDAGQRWRTYIRIMHNGQTVASVAVDTFTLEWLTDIKTYSGET